MPHTITDVTTFDDLRPYDLFRMRNRLEYLEHKGAALQQEAFRVLELRDRQGRFRCVTRMEVDVALPAWMKRFVRPRMEIVQHEAWYPPQPDGGRRYDFTVDVGNAPVRVTGTGVLTRVDWFSTRYEVQLTVQSTGRLFRERVEQFTADEMQEKIVAERDFMLHWFATVPDATTWV